MTSDLVLKHAHERRWVEWRENSAGQKVPYTPGTDHPAKPGVPSTWGTLAECRGPQVGIFLGQRLAGADLDGCRNPETQEVDEWAMELIIRLRSYTEVSPSGTGFKIFFYTDGPTPIHNSCSMPGVIKYSLDGKHSKKPALEIFSVRRYFTVTNEPMSKVLTGQGDVDLSQVREVTNEWTDLISTVLHNRKKKRQNKTPQYAGRNDALFREGCKLRRQNYSDIELERKLRELNIESSALHENFITNSSLPPGESGPLDERTFKVVLNQVLKYPTGDPGPNGELEEMNNRFTVLRSEGGKFRILSWHPSEIDKNFLEYGLRTKQDFCDGVVHPRVPVETDKGTKYMDLGKWWLNNPGRLEYESMTFEPGGPLIIGNRLNLWRGFGVVPRPGDWSLMQSHILEVLAARNQEHADWIIKWMAWSVQNPGKPGKVAIVFKGGQRTGKGTLGRALCRLFGVHGAHIASSEYVVGRFNNLLHQCCLLFADEAFYAGDRAGSRRLKAFITEPTINIERKGLSVISVQNCLHVIMATNERWAVPVDIDDWRFAIFRISDEFAHDQNYFGPLYDQLENGGYEAMLHDLLEMDLEGWAPDDNVPQTDEKEEQKAHSDDGSHWREKIENSVEKAFDSVNTDPEWKDPPLNEFSSILIYAMDARRLLHMPDHVWIRGDSLSRFGAVMKQLGFRYDKNRKAYLRGEAVYHTPYVRLEARYSETDREWQLYVKRDLPEFKVQY